MFSVIFEGMKRKKKKRGKKTGLIFLSNPIFMSLTCLSDSTTVGPASMPDPLKLELGMFNIIIFIIINIVNIILNKFEKKY
jgi:predicted AlkP superfamily pyrophosphatase or phosphodiesterase